MKKIGILTNFNVPEKADTARKAAYQASLAGATPLFPVYASQNRALADSLKAYNAEYLPLNDLYRTSDAVFCVGGDGSVIEAAKRAAECGIPVLGINRGRIGYITELEPAELERIPEIIEGNYRIEKRFLMKAEILRDGAVQKSAVVLNDAVLSNGYSGKVLDLRFAEGSETIAEYRADGMILSTPTGSTAYSLSAGGPVIDCRMECFCATPICPHSPAARPMIYPGTAVLDLSNGSNRNPEAIITLDGKFFGKLQKNDILRISDAGLRAGLVRIKPMKYYQSLCRKLD